MQPLVNQTQQALGMSEDMPANGAMDAPAGNGRHPNYDDEIRTNLEAHLDAIPDQQKAFIVDNLNPTTIALLGIVNGQEVYDYFAEIYQTQILPQGPQNSGVQPDMANTGAMPQGTNPQLQAKATPAGPPVGPL